MIDMIGLLEQAGVHVWRETDKEVWAPCPMHEERTGRPDNHPSWSINKNTALHSCFSCGYAGNLTGLLVDLTGSAPVDLELTLQTESFLRTMVEVRRRPEEVLEEVVPTLTDWVLTNIMVDVPERLLQMRWLRRFAVDAYEVRWDGDTKQWVLPMRSPKGDLLGAQYRQKGAVFTLPEGMAKSSTLFGYRQARPFDQCVVVESPLDAVRLYGLGIPAVSTLGAWSSAEQASLLARNFSVVYMALDNDKAGWQGMEILSTLLRKRGCAAVPWDYTNLVDGEGRPAKDVGDVADDELLLSSWESTRRFGL